MTLTTIYADTKDGWLGMSDASYSNITTTNSSITVDDTSTSVHMGQIFSFSTYTAYQCAEFFDLSSLTPGPIVTGVDLWLYGITDNSSTDFTIEARAVTPNQPINNTDYRTSATYASATLLASFATSGFTTINYNAFTENSNNLRSAVQSFGAGLWGFMLVSDKYRSATAPSAFEYVDIRGADWSGTSFDPLIMVTWTATNPPNAPTSLSATNSATVPQVNLSWSAPTTGGDFDSAVTYKVERAPDSGGSAGTYTQIASGVASTSTTDTGTSQGTKYWYRVRATNAGGDGSYSSAVSVTTPVVVNLGVQGGGTVAGTGTVQAAVVVEKPIPANVTGTGTVQAPAGVEVAKPAQVAGAGTVQASAATPTPTPSLVAGSGVVQTPKGIEVALPATVAGVGSVFKPTEASVVAVVTGVGTVQTSVPVDTPKPSLVSGVGTVQTPVGVEVAKPTLVSGVGTVQTAIAVDLPTPAVVAGVGTVQTIVGVEVAKPAVVTGVGTVQTSVPVDTPKPSLVSGVGTVQTVVGVVVPRPSTFVGTGLVGAPTLAPTILGTTAPSTVTGTGSVQAPHAMVSQIAVPDGTISNVGGWVTNTGSSTNIHLAIDEGPQVNDADYITVTAP